jgi:hypothetical protein
MDIREGEISKREKKNVPRTVQVRYISLHGIDDLPTL